MEVDGAYSIASNGGSVGESIEIEAVPEPYCKDYPNGWWRFVYGDIGGMIEARRMAMITP